jgi:lipopolysaccharide export system protein LptA
MGPTTIYNEESEVYCEDGYYDTQSGLAVFNRNVVMKNPPQLLKADSIYYNRETGIGRAFRNIEFTDTSRSILQYSNYAEYNEIENGIVSTAGSIAGYVVDNDTMFIAGDTIRSFQDSLDRKTMLVYHNVRIYKSDLQGMCDSLFYSDNDSILRLFGLPVMWSDSTQFTADTISMIIKNNELQQMNLYSNGFIINEDDSLIYNQIKGRNIFGYFLDDELHKIEVKGNGESVYYGKDNNDAYIGANKTLCSDIDIYLQDRKFSRVSFKGMPASEFHPMQVITLSDFILKDFEWLYNERPKSREELLQFQNAQPDGLIR